MRTHYWVSILVSSALALSACQRPAKVAAPEPLPPDYPDNIALRQRGLVKDNPSDSGVASQATQKPPTPAANADTPEARGEQLYNQHGCSSCHANKQVAPLLADLFGQSARKLANGATVKADEAYIRESIVNPAAKVAAGYPPIMPSYSHLPKEEIDALVAYIKSLRSAGGK